MTRRALATVVELVRELVYQNVHRIAGERRLDIFPGQHQRVRRPRIRRPAASADR